MATDEVKTNMDDNPNFYRYKGLIYNDGILTQNNNYNAWVNYAFNMEIKNNNTVTVSMKPLTSRIHDQGLHVGLCIGSVGVLNTYGHNHPGGYLDGLMWHCNGNVYCNRVNTGNIGAYAIGQTVAMKIINNKSIEFYVKGNKVKTINKNDIKSIDDNEILYPGISLLSKGTSVKVIEYSSKNN